MGLLYAGLQARGSDVFHNKTTMANVGRALTRGFKGIVNVYTQHKSLLLSTTQKLLDGKLKDGLYPFVERSVSAGQGKVNNALVFVVGGVTYEESRDITTLNREVAKNGQKVLCGGTTIHNTRSFLADVAQLGRGM